MCLDSPGDFRVDSRVTVVMRIDHGEKKIRTGVKLEITEAKGNGSCSVRNHAEKQV